MLSQMSWKDFWLNFLGMQILAEFSSEILLLHLQFGNQNCIREVRKIERISFIRYAAPKLIFSCPKALQHLKHYLPCWYKTIWCILCVWYIIIRHVMLVKYLLYCISKVRYSHFQSAIFISERGCDNTWWWFLSLMIKLHMALIFYHMFQS